MKVWRLFDTTFSRIYLYKQFIKNKHDSKKAKKGTERGINLSTDTDLQQSPFTGNLMTTFCIAFLVLSLYGIGCDVEGRGRVEEEREGGERERIVNKTSAKYACCFFIGPLL
jgi:hypothetical protein